MKEYRFHLLFVFFLFGMWTSIHAYAQLPVAAPTVVPTSSAGTQLMTQKALEITKTAMKVVKEEEGVVTLTLYGNHSLVNKAQVVFFRRKGARMEVIATGAVTGEKKNETTQLVEILVELVRDTVIKYPQKGDYAVPLSDPNALGKGDKKDSNDFFVPEEMSVKSENDRSGYLEYGLGILQGTLTTAASSTANGSSTVNGAKKTSNYRFKNSHFAYFSEFFPVGVELDSHGGDFPTQTYYRKVVKSSESISTLSLSYRFKTLFHHHLAPVLKVTRLSDTFLTDNTDENLLSTKISGLGFGLKINYDLVSPVWKASRGEFFLRLQNIFGEFTYYPSLDASDVGSDGSASALAVSRGTSSPGSSGMSYRLGFNALAYLNFVPIFKRFLIQGSYGLRSYNLKFTGNTVTELGNPNLIPSGGTSKEQEQDFRIFIGIRIDDPIKLIFQDSDQKEKSK